MKLYHVVVVGLVGIGLVGSVGEYRDWKYQETFKYGQGVADQAGKVEVKLDGPYQNNKEKIRLKYPENWDVIESGRAGEQESVSSVVRFENPFAQIKVTVGKLEGNLPDIVTEAAAGKNVTGDREYVNGSRMGFTVITWLDGNKTYQKAMGERAGKLVVIDVVTESRMWTSLEKTFGEVYKSVVLF